MVLANDHQTIELDNKVFILIFISFEFYIKRKNSKMKKIKNFVLVLAVVATKDSRAMNPECPDIVGKY